MTTEPSVPCPTCGGALMERVNRQTMTTFMGCERFPECRWTEPVPAAVEVARAGGLPLPGFGDEGETS